mgnify:CR=1 FL=1
MLQEDFSRTLPFMLDHLNALLKANPDYWTPYQFESDDNPLAHLTTTAPEIWEQTGGDVDFFVAGAGMGVAHMVSAFGAVGVVTLSLSTSTCLHLVSKGFQLSTLLFISGSRFQQFTLGLFQLDPSLTGLTRGFEFIPKRTDRTLPALRPSAVERVGAR